MLQSGVRLVALWDCDGGANSFANGNPQQLFLPSCIGANVPAVWVFEALFKTLWAVNSRTQRTGKEGPSFLGVHYYGVQGRIKGG